MSEWQKIKTAPVDTWVLVVTPPNPTVIHEICKLQLTSGKWMWWDGKGFYRLNTFTHWMPLPPSPEAKP